MEGQIEMWTLLGSTAEQLAGGLRSPKNAPAEAGAVTGKERPRGLSARQDRAKPWTPRPLTGAAKGWRGRPRS